MSVPTALSLVLLLYEATSVSLSTVVKYMYSQAVVENITSKCVLCSEPASAHMATA